MLYHARCIRRRRSRRSDAKTAQLCSTRKKSSDVWDFSWITAFVLKSYSVFIARVREQVENGRTLEAAVGEAVRYCIANDYLKEYFRQKHKEEVFDMLNFVWDQERALEVRAEEAREEGMEKGMVSSIGRVMKSLNLPLERAMDVLQIPAAERAKYAALVKG